MTTGEDELLARAAKEWWPEACAVVSELGRRGRPDLGVQAFQLIAGRWDPNPRGEYGWDRTNLVDDLALLHPHPEVAGELRRTLTDQRHLEVRLRALHHLLRLGLEPVDADLHARIPADLLPHLPRVLHDLGLHDEAQRQVHRAGGTRDDPWYFAGPDDLSSLSDVDLDGVAGAHEQWYVRAWAAQELLRRGHRDTALRHLARLLATPPGAIRDRVAAQAPAEAVATAVAHIRRTEGLEAVVSAAASPALDVQRPAIEALRRRRRLDVPRTVAQLRSKGGYGLVAAYVLAVASRQVDADPVLEQLVQQTATSRDSLLATRLLRLGLPDAAGAVAGALVCSLDPELPTNHVQEALRVLAQVRPPQAAELIGWVAGPVPQVPREWHDHYLQKAARHFLAQLEKR